MPLHISAHALTNASWSCKTRKLPSSMGMSKAATKHSAPKHAKVMVSQIMVCSVTAPLPPKGEHLESRQFPHCIKARLKSYKCHIHEKRGVAHYCHRQQVPPSKSLSILKTLPLCLESVWYRLAERIWLLENGTNRETGWPEMQQSHRQIQAMQLSTCAFWAGTCYWIKPKVECRSSIMHRQTSLENPKLSERTGS